MGNSVRSPSSLLCCMMRTVGLSTGLKKENKRVVKTKIIPLSLVKIELQIAAFWIKVVKDRTYSSGGFILIFLSCKIMCCKRRFVLLVLTGHFKIFLDGKKRKRLNKAKNFVIMYCLY